MLQYGLFCSPTCYNDAHLSRIKPGLLYQTLKLASHLANGRLILNDTLYSVRYVLVLIGVES